MTPYIAVEYHKETQVWTTARKFNTLKAARIWCCKNRTKGVFRAVSDDWVSPPPQPPPPPQKQAYQDKRRCYICQKIFWGGEHDYFNNYFNNNNALLCPDCYRDTVVMSEARKLARMIP